MTHMLFLDASARPDGNTVALARHAASALPEDVQQTWLRLADLDLPPVRDIRHDPARAAELGVRPTVLSEEDTTQADPVQGMLRRTAEYMGMRWGGCCSATATDPATRPVSWTSEPVR